MTPWKPWHITVTTKALDEAGDRISRFLFMQVIVNATYGLAMGAGLYILGLEHVLLWGVLAALVRYLPYVGPWTGALLPIMISAVTSDSWIQPVLVVTFIVVLEVLSNNFMETWLYSHSIGVSEVALLISAAFWTFLWGMIGLLLAAPLTVCLVILGRYVPQLNVLEILLGDQPVLGPEIRFYQRLLARDQDEAARLVLERLKDSPREAVYDEVILPALWHAKRELSRDHITDQDVEFIIRATREILESVADDEPADYAHDDVITVLGCVAQDDVDELSLSMLAGLLDSRWQFEFSTSTRLISEDLDHIQNERPALVCIASVPPGGLAHIRHLCKRIRSHAPKIKIVVGRWVVDDEQAVSMIRDAGANVVTTSITDACKQLKTLRPVLEAASRTPHVLST